LVTVTLGLTNYWFDTQRQNELAEWEARKEQLAKTQPEESKPLPIVAPVALTDPSETFYVLENDYQQLVFSTKGGALAEINLPFKSAADEESAVKEIEYDRDMVKDHAYNAHFPAHPYYTPGSDPKGNYVHHDEGKLGGFYPLIRRDLIQVPPRKSVNIPSKYYAANIVSEYPELAEMPYTVTHFDKNSITFESTTGQRKITKTFSIASESQGAPYTIDLTIDIDGDSRGLWLTSGVPEVEWISGAPAPALKIRLTRNKKSQVESLTLPEDSLVTTSVQPDWITNSNGFFGIILDALTPVDLGYKAQFVSGEAVPSRLVEIEQEFNTFSAEKLPGYMMMLPLKSNGGKMTYRVFAGPFSGAILKEVDNTFSDSATGYNPDYIASQSFHGWFSFISEPFTKLLFFIMSMFHSLTGSWALSIVLLTVVLRIMLYPLNSWSARSMYQMQQIAPEVAKIQERHKKDPKKAQVEIMTLYRERGVNPLSGCLPILIQIPFLMWMYDLLKSTYELRGAPFIPGWIDNLAAPDVLFSWTTPIWFIGNEFHLLPVLLGALMFVQQRYLTPGPTDPSQMTETQRQQRAMSSVMTLAFTLLFYNLPSGLNIYWLSSTLLGIIQQWWTQRQLKAATGGNATK
jgi:YidC/Oxa1 family membrane protein insertase